MTTPNHGYNAPEEGTTDWHAPLNENIRNLDADLAVRDRARNRDEYRPRDGAKYTALDTGQTFVGTGDRWRELPADPADPGMTDLAGVRVARSAAEIQPAIDALAERRDGRVSGGIVQLDARTYYPETTIWLKRGVMLRGVRRAVSAASSPSADAVTGTVISTRDMAEGAGAIDTTEGANTFSHANPAGEHWHPHFPVIGNFRTNPYALTDREPTDYEADHWGHQVAVKNVVIDAGAKPRWWDDGSHEATYFGVYDAVLFEFSRDVLIENVETRNVLGYGGFFNGCRGLLDRGSHWRGGATDYHGSALHTNIGYPPDPTLYSSGTWDVSVSGPAPTVLLEGHSPHEFVAGGWSGATIRATGRQFLGTEADYWDGTATLTNPDRDQGVVVHRNCTTRMDGYTIDAQPYLDGFRAFDSNAAVSNVTVEHAGVGLHQVGRNPFRVARCTVRDAEVGLRCGGNSPRLEDLRIEHCPEGIRFGGRANQPHLMEGITFADVGTAFGSGNNGNNPVHIHNVLLSGADAAGDTGEYLTLHDPVDPDGLLD